MIVDPWGLILADTGDKPGVAIAEIDSSHLEQVRRQMPSLQHRVFISWPENKVWSLTFEELETENEEIADEYKNLQKKVKKQVSEAEKATFKALDEKVKSDEEVTRL